MKTLGPWGIHTLDLKMLSLRFYSKLLRQLFFSKLPVGFKIDTDERRSSVRLWQETNLYVVSSRIKSDSLSIIVLDHS